MSSMHTRPAGFRLFSIRVAFRTTGPCTLIRTRSCRPGWIHVDATTSAAPVCGAAGSARKHFEHPQGSISVEPRNTLGGAAAIAESLVFIADAIRLHIPEIATHQWRASFGT